MHKAIKNALRPASTLRTADKAALKQIIHEMKHPDPASTTVSVAAALAHFADRIETELGIAQ